MDSTALTSPAARSLTTKAFELLREDILSGRLAPNERLRILALSERYQIGATAIREALSRLVTDGLVDSEDQRGFAVAPVSQSDLLDLTRTRVQLEQLALRGAVAVGDVDWESSLLAAYHRLSRSAPPATQEARAMWAAVHRQFHEALIAGCRSQWTLRLCRLLYDRSERYRNLATRADHERERANGDEHRALLDAALARDADLLCRLVDEHFWRTTNAIMETGFGAGPAGR